MSCQGARTFSKAAVRGTEMRLISKAGVVFEIKPYPCYVFEILTYFFLRGYFSSIPTLSFDLWYT